METPWGWPMLDINEWARGLFLRRPRLAGVVLLASAGAFWGLNTVAASMKDAAAPMGS